jgi:uncharacterized protein YecT (DUF1311 family)
MKKILLLVLLVPFIAFSQDIEKEKHPIDIQFADCKNGNTAEMLECTYNEYEAWDKEMNKYYKLLMGVLGEEEKARLKEAQRKWIAFRDAEIEFSATLNRNKQGTMWPVIHAANKIAIVRQRTIDLTGYYEMETTGE